MQEYPNLKLTPEEYELEVKKNLDALSLNLIDYQSSHRERIAGFDGEYEIDISVRFNALGVTYLTLIECKRHNKPVSREKAQALLAKMQSTGAQKGIIFSTSGFQSGAIEFADVHGIALVEFVDGRASYVRKSAHDGPIPWSEIPDYIPKIIGWRHKGNGHSIVSPSYPKCLNEFLLEE